MHCPLLPPGERDPGSMGLLVGVVALGVGGFGHLLLLAHIYQAVLGVVSCCSGGGRGEDCSRLLRVVEGCRTLWMAFEYEGR